MRKKATFEREQTSAKEKEFMKFFTDICEPATLEYSVEAISATSYLAGIAKGETSELTSHQLNPLHNHLGR